MNKQIITYSRVSTEEQGTGHSLQQQEDAIRRYCDQNGYTIIRHFQEKCSGKDFNRPVFKELYEFARKNRKSIDALFVLRFDRLGRDIEKNFKTIKKFRELDIEVNSVENPIDFSSLEHKLLLSINFAMGETERDKIRLRTRQNMQHAKQCGYWCGTAPYGYDNCRDNNGKSTLMPNDDAKLVQLFFDEYAKGVYSIDDVRKKLMKIGWSKSKNSSINIIKNRVYTGKVKVSSEDNDGVLWVEGVHAAIVEEEVFKKCQKIIKGNYRPPVLITSVIDDALVLRGIILCESCHKPLTGSLSAGRGGEKRYGYIHCNPPCKIRYKSRDVDVLFEKLLKQLALQDNFKDLYRNQLRDRFNANKENYRLQKESLLREKAKLEKRMESLHLKFIDDELDKNSFDLMNDKLSVQIDGITTEIEKIKDMDKGFEKHLHEGISFLNGFDTVYRQASVQLKRKMIHSLFPAKLYYTSQGFIAPKIDRAIEMLLDMGNVSLLRIAEKMQ